jgi:hypothetical protein
MAPRINPRRPPPLGFPSWAEFSAIALFVLWLVGIVAIESFVSWVHLLLVVAVVILAVSFWSNRSPRGDL